jgi:hypothetical protein
MPKTQVTESRLFVITPKEKTGTFTTELRIVSWNYRAPVLEKRTYWRKDENDSWSIGGKNLGFNAQDNNAVKAVQKKVDMLLALKDENEILKVEEARKAKVSK